jgi:tRNA-modifying protein YgfZ
MNDCLISLTPDLALIKINGANAESFLQGQLTCDLREVSALQSRLAAHCNAKGRVLATLRVIKFQQDFYLILPSNMAALTLKELGKYAPFSRVTLQQSAEITLLGCYSDKIAQDLHQILGNLPKQPDEAITTPAAILCIRLLADKPRFILIGHPTAMQPVQQTLSRQYPSVDSHIWRRLDIENGIAVISPPTSDLFTPHMLNYPQLNAVSFNKGCYIGQEVIARTHYLGKVKRHLTLLMLEKEYRPGDKLYNAEQQKIGVVIDAVQTGPLEFRVLAVMQEG